MLCWLGTKAVYRMQMSSVKMMFDQWNFPTQGIENNKKE